MRILLLVPACIRNERSCQGYEEDCMHRIPLSAWEATNTSGSRSCKTKLANVCTSFVCYSTYILCMSALEHVSAYKECNLLLLLILSKLKDMGYRKHEL